MKKRMVLLGITFCVNMLMAGGLALSGVGTRAISMGGAMRGLADDNTAIFWNPAGLSFLDESTFTLTAATINSYGEIVNPADEKFENEPEMHAFPNFSYAPRAMSKFNYGIGMFVPYGLGSKWDMIKPLNEQLPMYEWDNDIKEFDTQAAIAIVDIHPGFSYRISEKLSIGFGISIMYGQISMSKVQFAADYSTAVELDLEGDGFAFGANFGAMYKMNDKLTLGISGKLPTSITVEGDTDMKIHSSNAATQATPVTNKTEHGTEAEMKLPADIGFGFSYNINPTWLVSADFTYTTWKDLDKAPIEFDEMTPIGKSTEIVMEWDNTIRFSVGAENLYNNFAFRYGYYFDQSPIPEETLSPTWPDINDKHSINLGLGYTYNNFQFDYGFEYLKFTEREVEEDNAPENYLGTYNVDIIAMNFGITYKF